MPCPVGYHLRRAQPQPRGKLGLGNQPGSGESPSGLACPVRLCLAGVPVAALSAFTVAQGSNPVHPSSIPNVKRRTRLRKLFRLCAYTRAHVVDNVPRTRKRVHCGLTSLRGFHSRRCCKSNPLLLVSHRLAQQTDVPKSKDRNLELFPGDRGHGVVHLDLEQQVTGNFGSGAANQPAVLLVLRTG